MVRCSAPFQQLALRLAWFVCPPGAACFLPLPMQCTQSRRPPSYAWQAFFIIRSTHQEVHRALGVDVAERQRLLILVNDLQWSR